MHFLHVTKIRVSTSGRPLAEPTMGTVDVNKSHYQQHNNDFVYNSSEEDEVASSYDLRYYQRHHLKTRRRVRAETVRSLVHKKENASLIDNVHAECVDCNDDPDFAIELKRQVLKSVKGIHEPNTVLVAVEVRRRKIL